MNPATQELRLPALETEETERVQQKNDLLRTRWTERGTGFKSLQGYRAGSALISSKSPERKSRMQPLGETRVTSSEKKEQKEWDSLSLSRRKKLEQSGWRPNGATAAFVRGLDRAQMPQPHSKPSHDP